MAAGFALLSLFVYFVAIPTTNYLRNPKGLRKYPNLHPLSGITDLVFICHARRGFRSKALFEARKKSPVVRIGPNSLSYGNIRAIKDIYGHTTKCTKGLMYSELAGTHYHLADVVDKPEHARKCKVLSSAYTIKNLEGWEHKVADMTSRMIKALDARCTQPLPANQPRPNPEDLTVDYRMWSNLFTIQAIANIGLSEDLHFLDQGSDIVTAERMDGSLHQVNYRECLHATARAQS